MTPYIAKYKCENCHHRYEVAQGDFACPEGFVGQSCGANDPAKCTVKDGCWGCSACGRSRRRYRCSMCIAPKICPQCQHKYVKWLNPEYT